MRVTLIVNPASGQEQPVLSVANRVFAERDVDWDVTVTRAAGDAHDAAAASDADRVVVYGGDGTVGEAAQGALASGRPLAILPGGTGNALAQELGVPLDLERACHLAADADAPEACLDVGRCDDARFFQRVGIGMDAEAIRNADREAKNRFGWLAYLDAATQAFLDAEPRTHTFVIDGREVAVDAVSCVIANVARIGRGGFQLAPGVSPCDGILDLVVLRRADAGAIGAFAGSWFESWNHRGPDTPDDLADGDAPLVHLQFRELEIRVDPALPVQRDGEAAGDTPVSFRLDSDKLPVVVPPREGDE